MIVFGLVAFDNAVAVIQTHPQLKPMSSQIPSPITLVKALLLPPTSYNSQHIDALVQALERLRKKSRSFYLASALFTGALRIDLILLYSFYRVSDDLVDEAQTPEEARFWIAQLSAFLDARYNTEVQKSFADVLDGFPPSTRLTLASLPTNILSRRPFDDLLCGFATDARFLAGETPIADLPALEVYAARVAGTVAESCLELCFHHCPSQLSAADRAAVLSAGRTMGQALQLVNIARDVVTDAKTLRRVYLPATWLKERDLTARDILGDPTSEAVQALRQCLLDVAFRLYEEARPSIEMLPPGARAPMRVAVESYMEIGRTLRRPGYAVRAGRATVPAWRRLYVAWNALRG